MSWPWQSRKRSDTVESFSSLKRFLSRRSRTSGDEKPSSVPSSLRAVSEDSSTAPASLEKTVGVETIGARSSSASSDVGEVELGRSPLQGESAAEDLRAEKIGWKIASAILVAETISLGVLSLPSALAKLGIVVGGIMIFLFFLLTYSAGLMLYRVKLKYPELQGFADAARMIGGTPAAWIAETLNLSLLVFVMAGHIVIFSEEAKALSEPNLWKCSVAFKTIGFVICLVPSLMRTLKSQKWFSFASCASIVISIFIAIIGVAKQNPGQGVFAVVPPTQTPFANWGMAVSNILVGFAGHLAYFKVMDEMEKPEDFKKSLTLSGAVMCTLYVLTGVVIYRYAGDTVGALALNSLPPKLQKAAFGIASPTIVVAGVFAAYFACKRIELDFWTARKKPAMVNDTGKKAKLAWVVIVFSTWLVAFLLSIVLPFFDILLALLGASCGTWICMGLPAWYYLYVIRQEWREGRFNVHHEELEQEKWWACFKLPTGARWKTLMVWTYCVFLFVAAVFLCIVGMYGSIAAFVKEIQSGEGLHIFSCKF